MSNEIGDISTLSRALSEQIKAENLSAEEIATKFQMFYVLGLGDVAEQSRATILQQPRNASLLAQFEYLVQTKAVIEIYRCLSKSLPSINQVPVEFQDDIRGIQQSCIDMETAAEQSDEALAVLRKVLKGASTP